MSDKRATTAYDAHMSFLKCEGYVGSNAQCLAASKLLVYMHTGHQPQHRLPDHILKLTRSRHVEGLFVFKEPCDAPGIRDLVLAW